MEFVKNKINKFIEKKYVPNLLFYGPCEEGKKEILNYFIQKIYKNNEKINKYVLNIDCLSTHGIKLIKENIKLFSKQIIAKEQNNIYFKTIILKNCEYLTYDSQYSLRRTIEMFSNNTRFIMLCDNKGKLLSPICSRFVQLYVNNIEEPKIYNYIDKINSKIINDLYKKYNLIIQNNDENVIKNIMDLSYEIYNNDLCVDDILKKFKNHTNYNIVNLVIDNINLNFRSEVLSIFYILNVFRNNQKIQISNLY